MARAEALSLHGAQGYERRALRFGHAGQARDATAKTHVSRAMLKLGARDRAQLVVLAYQTGLAIPEWKVSDRFWEEIAPLVPAAPSHAKGGRPRLSDRQAFEAIVYVLRTGIQWNALPRELGASSTVHDRFQEWQRAGFFHALWAAGLAEYDELRGLEWTRRWVVERTHAWLDRSRRLLVRWEKKAENYLAFIQLACAHLIFSKLAVSG
jgi:transposase